MAITYIGIADFVALWPADLRRGPVAGGSAAWPCNRRISGVAL
jgi:hypothetical protein